MYMHISVRNSATQVVVLRCTGAQVCIGIQLGLQGSGYQVKKASKPFIPLHADIKTHRTPFPSCSAGGTSILT